MFRKMFSSGGILLVGAATLAMPGSGWAHGGGHAVVGGGHVAGHGPLVGGHVGVSRGGFSSYPHAYSHSNYGHYPFSGIWAGGTFSPLFGASGYIGPGPAYHLWYSGGGGGPMPPQQEGFPPVPPPVSSEALADTRAHVTVHVPAEARVWFDGTATTSTGPIRKFQSLPLTQGDRYSYEIKASWKENGREVTETREVVVISGAHVEVKFAVLPRTEGQGSAQKKN